MQKTTTASKIGYGFAALLGITLVIVVHEFGHFAACKLFNVRTPTFSIGFNPAIISRPIGGTNFQIGAIPLGGYVSINQYDFNKISYSKKMVIMLAGIVFNILFTLAILYILSLQNSGLESQTEYRSLLSRATPDAVKEILEHQKAGFIGPVGIIKMISQGAQLGLDAYFYFLAIISLNIAIFNLLPIPFLDGGQAFEITLQKIFGRNLDSWITTLIYLLLALAWIVLSKLNRKKENDRSI